MFYWWYYLALHFCYYTAIRRLSDKKLVCSYLSQKTPLTKYIYMLIQVKTNVVFSVIYATSCQWVKKKSYQLLSIISWVPTKEQHTRSSDGWTSSCVGKWHSKMIPRWVLFFYPKKDIFDSAPQREAEKWRHGEYSLIWSTKASEAALTSLSRKTPPSRAVPPAN